MRALNKAGSLMSGRYKMPLRCYRMPREVHDQSRPMFSLPQLSVLSLLSPEQKAQLILHPGNGDLDTISLVFQSLLGPLINNAHLNQSMYNATLRSNMTAGNATGPHELDRVRYVFFLLFYFFTWIPISFSRSISYPPWGPQKKHKT